MSAPRVTPTALAVSSEAERAAILDELVAADRELGDRAERAARSRLADADTGDAANALASALLALDQEELAAHAGRTRHGYVEPTEAAWWLLERAVEPWLEDITRRASLGFGEAAGRLGLGILDALQRIDEHAGNDELLLSWAPDFPGETANRVTRVLADAGIDLTDTELARVAPDLM
jgi:hypothetical protein